MEAIVIKKVVPPTEGDEARKKVVKEGLNQVIESLKEKGYLTCSEEPIDDYVILTFKVAEPLIKGSLKSETSVQG